MRLASRIAALVERMTSRYGETLTFVRLGRATNVSATCMVQEMPGGLRPGRFEALGQNLADERRHQLIIPPETDVQDGDTFTWDGYVWRIQGTHNGHLQGTGFVIIAQATRGKIA